MAGDGVQRLVEHVGDWRDTEVRVDRDARLVRSVALAGRASRNGYRYADAALREAAVLYDGKPVFLDHAAPAGRPFERSTRDLVGSIVNPRYAEGRIRGDVQALDTEAGRTFLALALSQSPAVGMSHVVLAERSADGAVVERIHDVVSVDAVVFPATAASFRESTQPDAPPAPEPATPEPATPEPATPEPPTPEPPTPEPPTPEPPTPEPGVAAPDLSPPAPAPDGTAGRPDAAHAAGGASQDQTAALARELEATAAERDTLRLRVAELEAERRAAETERAVERLLAEAGLPAYAVTDLFRRQLIAADAPTRTDLVAERRALVRRTAGDPRSETRRETPDASDAALIAAVRGE